MPSTLSSHSALSTLHSALSSHSALSTLHSALREALSTLHSALKKALTWVKTLCQSPGWGWRNRRIVGYQGVLSPCIIHRQSGEKHNSSQTGLPNVPARWATAVSTVMIKSSWAIAAAVSAKSLSWSSREIKLGYSLSMSATRGPFCKL
uniref:Uncharacterized protein n=1 Tax=Desertifilum tharense IPPAS B-1220 TaxID=1781255 RepID=A0ACD5GSU4_9CYAN